MGDNSGNVVSGTSGVTWGVARISLGCVRFVDIGWAGRGDSLGKRSVSYLNILERASSAVACQPG